MRIDVAIGLVRHLERAGAAVPGEQLTWLSTAEPKRALKAKSSLLFGGCDADGDAAFTRKDPNRGLTIVSPTERLRGDGCCLLRIERVRLCEQGLDGKHS